MSQERICKHACQKIAELVSKYKYMADTIAPGHDCAGSAEDGDTVNAAEGTDDNAEEDEEDDAADGTGVHAALNVSPLTSAGYVLRNLKMSTSLSQSISGCRHLADS